ncbi:MAG: hydrogenase nickel incorporation protein HypB [Alphaproteobacteria bacterium]|nr:hydrogenase nickel incorporation protein HypB [Alphaproteobacteria bacterium]
MCVTCGCSGPHKHDHDHEHDHHGDPHHDHSHEGPLGAKHDHETATTRAIAIEEDILGENNHYAAKNRAIFTEHKILALNLVSSPGSGKTTLLSKTLASQRFKAAVIEGDQSTDLDAARIRETGAPAVQINTGQGCHLDGHMVGHAIRDLGIPAGTVDGGVVFIENVGNLVCPAAFDLGEAAKVVLLSVTEGEDKPLKYPHMFAASKLMILTKIDLLPYVPFDVEKCIAYARQVAPQIEVIQLSSTTGAGMEDWLNWIDSHK